MTKYPNPFYTHNEACAILENLGVSPLRNLPPEKVDWRELILSIITNRKYEGGDYHFVVSIHIEREGFDALLEMLPKDTCIPRRSRHTTDFDKIAIYLDKDHYMFEIMALIPREDLQ